MIATETPARPRRTPQLWTQPEAKPQCEVSFDMLQQFCGSSRGLASTQALFCLSWANLGWRVFNLEWGGGQ